MEEFDHELLISCSAGLGGCKPNTMIYCKTDDCVECLEDLQRFLRQDDPDKRLAFFALGKMNVANSDLVPLLLAYPEDKDIVFNAVKVATFLTMPVDPTSEAAHKQVECMQLVKEAFLAEDCLAVVAALVTKPLEKVARMSEQDAQLVQLILTFVRNLLCIPDRLPTAGSRGDHKSRMRSDLLSCLFDNDIMELLLVMAQHINQGRLRADSALLLEVFSRVFQGLKAKELLHAKAPQTTAQTSRAEQSRARMLDVKSSFKREKEVVKSMRGPARHARHSATFMRVDPRQLGSFSIMRNAPSKPMLPTLPCQKPKTKQMLTEESGSDLHWSLQVRMRTYLEHFLKGSYGSLMGVVRKLLEPGLGVSRLGRDDFVRFLALARLCSSFVRIREEDAVRLRRAAQKENRSMADGEQQDNPGEEHSPFAAVSATMGWETFHLVQMLWLSVIDLPPSSKEKDWDLQHSATTLLKEMLLILDLAQQLGSPSDRRAADRLSRRLLHDDQKESGLLPVLGRLLKDFSFSHQPCSHAAEVVQAIHITLRLLERLSQQESGAFLVKRRVPVRRRRATPPAAAAKLLGADAQGTEQSADSPAQQVGQNGAGDEGQQEPGGIPAADGSEGSKEAANVEESAGSDAEPAPAMARSRDPFEELEEEQELKAQKERTKEVAYNLYQRVRQELAFPAVVHLYTWLLHGYSTNGTFLNHCIVAFLKRIISPSALNLEPMLYQLSILRVFEQILSDKAFRGQKHSAELVLLCADVTRSLFARLLPSTAPTAAQSAGREGVPNVQGIDHDDHGEGDDNVQSADCTLSAEHPNSLTEREAEVKKGVASTLFVELLFWKTQKEAEDVREEYNWRHIYRSRGVSPERSVSRSPLGHAPLGAALSTTQEARLRELFEQHGMEKGYLDIITDNFEEGWPRTRIARHLKALGLKRGVLTEGQRITLRELFEEHSKKRGFLQLIADSMPGSFRKSQISTHLRKMGLKRQKGKNAFPSSGSSSGSSDEGGSDGHAGGGHSERHPSQAAKGKQMVDWPDDDSEPEEQRQHADWLSDDSQPEQRRQQQSEQGLTVTEQPNDQLGLRQPSPSEAPGKKHSSVASKPPSTDKPGTPESPEDAAGSSPNSQQDTAQNAGRKSSEVAPSGKDTREAGVQRIAPSSVDLPVAHVSEEPDTEENLIVPAKRRRLAKKAAATVAIDMSDLEDI